MGYFLTPLRVLITLFYYAKNVVTVAGINIFTSLPEVVFVILTNEF